MRHLVARMSLRFSGSPRAAREDLRDADFTAPTAITTENYLASTLLVKAGGLATRSSEIRS